MVHRDTLWLIAGEPEPVPNGWIAVADVIRPLLWRPPGVQEPCPFARFSGDVPSDAQRHELLYAAGWAIIDLCPTWAILSPRGEPAKWVEVLAPPPSGYRNVSTNEHVYLLQGVIGSGTAFEEKTRERFGELYGRPVLLWKAEVDMALRALGFDTSRTAAAEKRALRALLDDLSRMAPRYPSKADLKATHAPDLPDKAWERVWSEARTKFPKIGRPGRKTKNRPPEIATPNTRG
jgi:hypothetical protein